MRTVALALLPILAAGAAVRAQPAEEVRAIEVVMRCAGQLMAMARCIREPRAAAVLDRKATVRPDAARAALTTEFGRGTFAALEALLPRRAEAEAPGQGHQA